MRLFYAVLPLALGISFAAHAQQPFERFGLKIKVATLSGGRYPEFFANDSLRRIGSVVYNTRLRRIAYLLPGDSLIGQARPEVTSRWLSPDPLAEKYLFISPYVYVSDNPVNKSDPDGREEKDVILRGLQAKAAFQQLQASVASSLSLDMDKSGKVSYTQAPNSPPTAGAQALMKAVDDHSVTVNATAVGTDQQITPNNQIIAGGAFMGNTVNPTDKTVQTQQTMVVPVLQKIDGYFNKPGATTLHEVVESYLGGTMSQQAGTSSSGSGTLGSVYDAAHAAAQGVAPQAGTYTTKYLDRQGNPMTPYQARQDPSQVGRVNNVVQEGTRPAQVVQTVP